MNKIKLLTTLSLAALVAACGGNSNGYIGAMGGEGSEWGIIVPETAKTQKPINEAQYDETGKKISVANTFTIPVGTDLDFDKNSYYLVVGDVKGTHYKVNLQDLKDDKGRLTTGYDYVSNADGKDAIAFNWSDNTTVLNPKDTTKRNNNIVNILNNNKNVTKLYWDDGAGTGTLEHKANVAVFEGTAKGYALNDGTIDGKAQDGTFTFNVDLLNAQIDGKIVAKDGATAGTSIYTAGGLELAGVKIHDSYFSGGFKGDASSSITGQFLGAGADNILGSWNAKDSLGGFDGTLIDKTTPGVGQSGAFDQDDYLTLPTDAVPPIGSI